METYPFENLSISLDKDGLREFSKVSYPVRYGRFGEIATPDFIFQFNLNGEIKTIQGRGRNWPHPSEWLKRTAGDDWIYYSSGNYADLYDLIGEYYLPCLSYPSNSVIGGNPFENHTVTSAIETWQRLQKELMGLVPDSVPGSLKDFLTRVTEFDANALRSRSLELHRLIGARVTVLPPDARHVDYEVIPLIVADGCLYHCGFCRVKSKQDFSARTKKDVLGQVQQLKRFYGRDLPNYNSIFLGNHDALLAGRDLLLFAAEHAYQMLDLGHSYLKNPRLFLFGSVDSMIQSEETTFESLNKLPFSTYLNVGFESADPETLALLGKPVRPEKVREAYMRMVDINRRYEKIEVTVNFVLGENLSSDHLPSLVELIRSGFNRPLDKGTLYLSPLIDPGIEDGGRKREILREFRKVKTQSHLPAYLYLIQRL